LDQFRHIFGTPDEGKRDQIAMLNRKFKVLTVFGRQGRNIKLRIGQVDTLLCTKFGSALSGMGNFDFKPGFAVFFVDRTDDTLNLTIVEENALTGPRISEDCRK
jgi:hypothetical protein